MLRRLSDSPVARLKARGLLNVWELTAADDILAAYRMAAGMPASRDPDLGMPPAEPRSDAADDRAARRSDVARIYTQWRSDLRGTLALLVTQAVVIGELPLRAWERNMRVRNGTARAHLLTGLRHFAALRGNTPRWARDWKMAPRKEAA